MQISQELPQFEDQKILIIVTGQQEASFYIAHKGNLDKLEGLYIPPITYSDKEGYSEKRRMGMTMGTGFARENKKQTLRNKFLSELDTHLKKIAGEHEIEKIYLFCPPYMRLSVKGVIPYPLKEKPIVSIKGDYHQQHPFKMLEKIKEAQKNKGGIKIIGEAAKKILDKAKQARKVIGK
ncbi:MAG: hypothetical protein Q8P99_01540 [bacterium]|nr:hypothetical protein [bacterium]